jgi:hypothetical protein
VSMPAPRSPVHPRVPGRSCGTVKPRLGRRAGQRRGAAAEHAAMNVDLVPLGGPRCHVHAPAEAGILHAENDRHVTGRRYRWTRVPCTGPHVVRALGQGWRTILPGMPPEAFARYALGTAAPPSPSSPSASQATTSPRSGSYATPTNSGPGSQADARPLPSGPLRADRWRKPAVRSHQWSRRHSVGADHIAVEAGA